MEESAEMTKLTRFINVLTGILMAAGGVWVLVNDTGSAMKIMLFFIQLGMTFRGIGSLYYYLTMARHMVGGKNVLYRAMVLLDLGILAGSLENHPTVYAITYLAILGGFGGVVSILRANEARKIKGHWKLKMILGVSELMLAVAITQIAVTFGRVDIAVYVYGASLIYSAVLRIAEAFRHNEIVFIQ